MSPTLTWNSLSTPAADDGISIDALSDSTVISDCSTVIVSPGMASNSITVTSLKSPMSGTLTSTGPAGVPALAAASTGAASAAAALGSEASAGAGVADAAAMPSASSTRMTVPCLTVLPTSTFSSLITPAPLDGISIDALSDSTVISD